MLKKSQAALIGWILLIGFAVTMAVFVSRWALHQAEESTIGVVEMTMGDIKCADTAISGDIDCEESFNITNRGLITVQNLTIRGFCTDGSTFDEGGWSITPIKPRSITGDEESSTKNLNTQCPISKIEVIPVIQVDNKLIGCSEKGLRLEC